MRDSHLPTILFLQDGDRRWAEREGVSYEVGYTEMTRKIGLLIDGLHRRGFTQLYLPSNSVANLERPTEQVEAWFDAYLKLLEFTSTKLCIKLRGDLTLLPEKYKQPYEQLEANTASNTEFTLQFLMHWSSLDEIARITNRLAATGQTITPEKLLAESDIPEPIDLIVRSGQRRRLSSFVPLSGQYAEIYFLDILFPDMTDAHIDAFLDGYKEQTRTFGK